jgi:hypothetical protein
MFGSANGILASYKTLPSITDKLNIFVSTDQDECCAGTFCDPQSTCVNDFTNFTCTCNTGYTGNGTSCEGTVDPIFHTSQWKDI